MSDGLVVRDVLPSGLRLVTERMPHVRSVTVGVWLARGSRHETEAQSGIAHFIEHMLFKGTATRSAEDIAQEIDSIGGQLDAFTAKEYASYYIKVLDEHLPLAVDLLRQQPASSQQPPLIAPHRGPQAEQCIGEQTPHRIGDVDAVQERNAAARRARLPTNMAAEMVEIEVNAKFNRKQ